jgi:hypothetical protein
MASALPPVLVLGPDDGLREQFAAWLRGSYDVETASGVDTIPADLPEETVVILEPSATDPKRESLSGRVNGRIGLVLPEAPDWDVVEAGFDGYIETPVTREALRRFVGRLMDRYRYESTIDDYYEAVSEHAIQTRARGFGRQVSTAGSTDARAIQEYEERLQGLLNAFEHEDYVALFRDLDHGG